MTDTRQAIRAQLAAQWEIAKGHLRAVAAISGSQPVEYDGPTGAPKPTNYDKLHVAIEALIKHVEDEELHEP